MIFSQIIADIRMKILKQKVMSEEEKFRHEIKPSWKAEYKEQLSKRANRENKE
jgi:hypothetical protein